MPRHMRAEHRMFRGVVDYAWLQDGKMINGQFIVGPYARPSTVKQQIARQIRWFDYKQGFEIVKITIEVNKGWEEFTDENVDSLP